MLTEAELDRLDGYINEIPPVIDTSIMMQKRLISQAREANRLREENAALREERDIAVGLHRLSEADLLALRAALAAQQEVVEALRPYASHKMDCRTWKMRSSPFDVPTNVKPYCDCGLQEILAPAPSASRDSEVRDVE